jgi:hypothetical protein
MYFLFNNDSKKYFELLSNESSETISFINIYPDYNSYDNQIKSGLKTIKDPAKFNLLLSCINNGKSVPRIEGELLQKELVAVISTVSKSQYAMQVNFSKSGVGFLGKFYNYYNFETDTVISHNSKSIKSQCLYDWFYSVKSINESSV